MREAKRAACACLFDGFITCLLARGRSQCTWTLDEIGSNGLVKGMTVHIGRLVFIACSPADLLNDVARKARPKFLLEVIADEADQVVRNGCIEWHAVFRCHAPEDLAELLVRNRTDFDLRFDAADKRRIDKLCRIKVGSENDQHLEWNFDFSAAFEREEVD